MILQTINNMQGEKDAGQGWYQLMVLIFEAFDLWPCPAEPALFVKHEGEESIIVVTSTDDFLCSSTSESLFANLVKHLEQYVPVTVQDGHILKYLNLRIIQTDQGISFDQTHHIKTNIVDEWFPASKTERIKSADTPYRTDSEYERQLQEQLPATGTVLADLEKEYGGRYNAIIGKFLHAEQVSRFDIGFAVTRLAQKNVAPNAAAFQGLSRTARYLATHLHSPIFYPRAKLTAYQWIRREDKPGKSWEM